MFNTFLTIGRKDLYIQNISTGKEPSFALDAFNKLQHEIFKYDNPIYCSTKDRQFRAEWIQGQLDIWVFR